MHSHELAVRWTDLDPNKHLNNVSYVNYAVESQAALVDAGVVGPQERPVAVTVAFQRPLLFTRRPALVESTRTGDVLEQEVCSRDGDRRVVYARLTTTFGAPAALEPGTGRGHDEPGRLRRSDLDAHGVATVAGIFELLQEGRARFAARHRDAMLDGALALGRMTLEVGPPLAWSETECTVRSRLTKVTGALVMIESDILRGGTVHARGSSVHMPFDIETQKPRRLTDEERASMTGLVETQEVA